MKEILLYSGGMDSYIAWHYLGKPETLFVDLGHRYRLKEYKAVLSTIPETKTISSLFIGKYEEDDANIPMRNLFLAMCAAWEGADKVWLIVQKDEMSIPDRSIDFMLEARPILSNLVKRDVRIATPFSDMDKTDMVRWYVDEVGDIGTLFQTVGCFSEHDGHCGDCGACLRRYIAFKNNRIDPGYVLSESIKESYRNRPGDYSIARWRKMEKWLQKS